ncbi:Hypothetical predicted protein [Marmota monax]|uniref:Transmembrane epididymal protein 1 n=1 Tax=Marmota monax TaxID=9995 RepID=A0A5E4AHZ6_MARMO|nr:Hypothetical predicted protein [Marmota monax]
MFTLLILMGCVDVMSKNMLPQRCVALEKGALVLSFYELLLLMVSHVKESLGIELQVHYLLILVVFLLLLVLTVELWAPEMFQLWMMETLLILIMGSWLIQAGFILYRPVSGYPWDDDDMNDLMFVTTFFCWHVMLVYVNNCIEGGIILMDRELPPRFLYSKEWQHLTMFTLLILMGCVDVMSKNMLPQRCVVLEKGALALSFYELLLLMVSHAKGSSGIELQVHSLLILVVLLLLLVLTVELWAPEMFQLWMMETLLILIMGSWLIQAGFILYRPVSGYPWDDDDMNDLMFVTTFFCWHVMCDALCLFAIYGFSYFWHRCYYSSLKMMESKEAPYHKSTPEPLYRLLQEIEQPEKEDQAPLLAKSSPRDKA